MKRKVIILGLGLLALAGVFAAILIMPAKPKAGPWRLADGSEISLAGVTYGRHHTMRYGDRLVDYLYPVLPNVLRKRFGCKVVKEDTQSSEIVVWIWNKGLQPNLPSGSRREIVLVVTDGDGNESESVINPYSGVTWRSTNVLEGWKLKHFPRRAKEIGVRIYTASVYRRDDLVGEFKLPNSVHFEAGHWEAETIPIKKSTNGLECALIRLETGLTNSPKLSGIPQEVCEMVSRAEIEVRVGAKLSPDWAVLRMEATSTSGEIMDADGGYYDHDSGASVTERIPVYFAGTLWRDEPAWKLRTELFRISNYPPSELWKVKGVTMPVDGRLVLGAKTNLHGSDLELVEIMRKGPSGKEFSDFELSIRSPLPEAGRYLRLVDAVDDNGRKLQHFAIGFTDSTGGRGATIRERNRRFMILAPVESRSLDVTLAYTESVSIDFMARPTIAKEAGQK